MAIPNGRGRNWRAKYALKDDVNILRGEFEHFVANDFKHLADMVKSNRKMLWSILIVVITLPTIFMITVVQILLK